MTEAHEIIRHLTEIVITPEHAERTESAEFRKSKERLKADGHFKCWICGTTENLQVHHMAEWVFANLVDFTKLKAFVEEWDVYGYGRLLRNKPIISVDDIRCLVMLCRRHHTGVDHEDGNGGTGIHNLTFPAWLIQRLAKEGEDPVPQEGESLEEALKEIEEIEKIEKGDVQNG